MKTFPDNLRPLNSFAWLTTVVGRGSRRAARSSNVIRSAGGSQDRSSGPNFQFPPERGRRGLTILEMLVSTAMLSFIVLGLTAVFIQTQRAFKTGIRQATVTDAGRTITDMIADDLRQMSDPGNTNVINFYVNLDPTNNVAQTNNLYTPGASFYLRTNVLEHIFILECTNNVWTGVGYAVSNTGLGYGSLYRYWVTTNSPFPFSTNAVFLGFSNSLYKYNFGGLNNTSTNWHRVADGVVDLRVRSYDLYGNINNAEDYAENGGPAPQYAYYAYPGPMTSIQPIPFQYELSLTNTFTLPTSVDLEVGVLEPDALAQVQSLPPTAQGGWMTNTAPGQEEIFHERITIPAVVR